MTRINITNLAMVIIMAINLCGAVSDYITPVRDVYLSNALGWFCAFCYIVANSCKEYNDTN